MEICLDEHGGLVCFTKWQMLRAVGRKPSRLGIVRYGDLASQVEAFRRPKSSVVLLLLCWMQQRADCHVIIQAGCIAPVGALRDNSRNRFVAPQHLRKVSIWGLSPRAS